MCNDIGEGSRCCAFYSFTGFIFTLWVGCMISTQPFFIAGLEDSDNARSSAFGAMTMFAVTFVVSLAGIWYDSQYAKETDSEEPESEYHLSTGDIPTYGTAA